MDGPCCLGSASKTPDRVTKESVPKTLETNAEDRREQARGETAGVPLDVPEWFHEALTDHAFRVDAAINRQATKASTEMESVKLDLWELGCRVEEMGKSLQHQQNKLQEVVERTLSLAQTAAIMQQCCENTDRRLHDAFNSRNEASHDKSNSPGFFWPSMMLGLASGGQGQCQHPFQGSDQQHQQISKACWELEARTTTKRNVEMSAMRQLLEEQIWHVQDVAVGLDESIKRYDGRMDDVEENIRMLNKTLHYMLQATKSMGLAIKRESGMTPITQSWKLFGKSKQDEASKNLPRQDGDLDAALEALDVFEQLSKTQFRSSHPHVVPTNGVSDENYGDPVIFVA
mmetsp:Transcript_120088/g.233930  ORF Transcript_120088/g.233930 Transcript_120088/m.233930 type:complete len:344 (+) Transcript_120088:56-1087(+)